MKKVKVLKIIEAEKTIIGVGATLILQNVAPPIIKLLQERYLQDNTYLEGDVSDLLKAKGTGKGNNDHLYQ